MIYEIYIYRDTKSRMYGSPVTSVNRACALRDFISVCERSPFGKDMELYKVGTFDSTRGVIEAVEPEFILEYASYDPEKEV